MDIQTLEQTEAQIANDMSLPSSFLESLLEEDDWSFVIKSRAFPEVLLTHALVEFFQRHELEKLIAHLDMTDARVGKMKFAAAIGIIKKDGERFIREFAYPFNTAKPLLPVIKKF